MSHKEKTEFSLPALSIRFNNMGGLSIKEQAKIEDDLRHTSFMLNGNETRVEELLQDGEQQRQIVEEAWKFATGPAQFFLLQTAATTCSPSYSFSEEHRSRMRTFEVKQIKGLFGYNQFEYASALNFCQLDAEHVPTGKQFEGMLRIRGKFNKGVTGHASELKVRLSIFKNASVSEDEIRRFLNQLKAAYFQDYQIYRRKLEVNVLRRLFAAILLNAATLTPLLILILIPLFSSMGLSAIPIAAISVGIALANFALMFLISTAVYALFYKLAKDRPNIIEEAITPPPAIGRRRSSVTSFPLDSKTKEKLTQASAPGDEPTSYEGGTPRLTASNNPYSLMPQPLAVALGGASGAFDRTQSEHTDPCSITPRSSQER